MDEYGYGEVAKVAIQLFEQSARQSGRTMRMIERVSDGDRIVVTTDQERRHIEVRLREAGKTKVRVIVWSNDGFSDAFRGQPEGRTFFDHTWVHQHFLRCLKNAETDLEHLQRETSASWPEKLEVDKSAARFVDWERGR